MQVGKLSACPALLRLDLSGNQLTSLAGLETSLQLKWLSASGNPLTDVSALETLSNLRVQLIAAPSTTQVSACTAQRGPAPPGAVELARARVCQLIYTHPPIPALADQQPDACLAFSIPSLIDPACNFQTHCQVGFVSKVSCCLPRSSLDGVRLSFSSSPLHLCALAYDDQRCCRAGLKPELLLARWQLGCGGAGVAARPHP